MLYWRDHVYPELRCVQVATSCAYKVYFLDGSPDTNSHCDIFEVCHRSIDQQEYRLAKGTSFDFWADSARKHYSFYHLLVCTSQGDGASIGGRYNRAFSYARRPYRAVDLYSADLSHDRAPCDEAQSLRHNAYRGNKLRGCDIAFWTGEIQDRQFWLLQQSQGSELLYSFHSLIQHNLLKVQQSQVGLIDFVLVN